MTLKKESPPVKHLDIRILENFMKEIKKQISKIHCKLHFYLRIAFSYSPSSSSSKVE
jgi:hypothetical protein